MGRKKKIKCYRRMGFKMNPLIADPTSHSRLGEWPRGLYYSTRVEVVCRDGYTGIGPADEFNWVPEEPGELDAYDLVWYRKVD